MIDAKTPFADVSILFPFNSFSLNSLGAIQRLLRCNKASEAIAFLRASRYVRYYVCICLHFPTICFIVSLSVNDGLAALGLNQFIMK